jgi:arginine exporter protein ArgO
LLLVRQTGKAQTMIKLLHTSAEALSVAFRNLKRSKERTMTKPTVTKQMVQAAWVAFINPHKLFDMRGAIQAALEAMNHD